MSNSSHSVKIIALFQFYFPYVLPRGNDWQGRSVAFQFPAFLVNVRPRDLEEELFPNDIDKRLSTVDLRLSKLSLPVGSISRTVRDLCLDRIEIMVEREFDAPGDVRQPEVQESYKRVAVRGCNLFINHCRVVSKSPFIVAVEEHYRLQDGKYYTITPYSLSWFEGEQGEQLPTYEGETNSMASPGAILSPWRGMLSMSLILQSLTQGIEPDLVESLLLDAQERIVTLRLREAILSIGTACEVAADMYICRKGKADDSQVEKLLKRKASFAEKRFHLVTNLLDSRSLKREDRTTFELIEKAYRTRNKVAHTGKAVYDDGDTEVDVEVSIATEFLNAAANATKWLAAL